MTEILEGEKLSREEKLDMLRSLSDEARDIREFEGLDCSINDLIIERFYKDEQHREFKLFKEWKAEGYRVIKGSRAFFVWGKKRARDKESSGGERPTADEQLKEGQNPDEKKPSFFPLAYLFSNAQVEKL